MDNPYGWEWGPPAVGALVAPYMWWWPHRARVPHGESHAGVAGWEQLTPAPVEEAAKLWPQEILISRNESLFHLTGWSFPMV